MALDVGTKTIGVALSDEDGRLASPLITLTRKGVRVDCDRLAQIVREREVGAVVVGLPLELDGTEKRSAKLARQIGDAMNERTGGISRYVDERFTSVEAERRLIEAGASRARRAQVIDQVAACLILQSWLDHGVAVEIHGHGDEA